MTSGTGRWILLGLAILTCGCSAGDKPTVAATQAGPLWFEEVTRSRGLDFVHDPGPTGTYFLPQIMGSGGAFLDIDNDGRLDIYLVQNAGPLSPSKNRLYHQQPDGSFRDISAGSGLDVAGYGMGVAVGDINNDGFVDVLLTEYGRTRLFLNQGNLTFREITGEAGIHNPLWGTSAAFFDYDRDGWLDLVVVNYVEYSPARPCDDAAGKRDYCSPSVFGGTVTKLYHNLGKQPDGKVRFEDVTIRSGLVLVPGPGLGVFCADFDGDHWPDILVAHDGRPNQLWINQRNGTFREEAVVRGVAYNSLGRAQANMGIAVGDLDGDGLFELFLTHLTEETHTLLKQGPRGLFKDHTAQAGLASPLWRGTGFGTVFVDFDHDGALDLALVNGRVSHVQVAGNSPSTDLLPIDAFWKPYAERNQLYQNDGRGRFTEISLNNAPFAGYAAVSRALAYGDFDNDGAVDLLATEIGGPARLFRNIAPNRGHWLQVRVIDPALKRDAYGSEITVSADGKSLRRWANPGSSYLCSNDPRVHFGLGDCTRVERITVLWPDGVEESFSGTGVDQFLTLKKGQGMAVPRQP